MALKKSELYSSLWSSCDELRGGMDASQYKDYVLILLFVKYVSDKYAGKDDALIEIPAGGGFADMVKLKGDKAIGDKINKIIAKLAEANDLKGVIDQADWDDADKLGNGKEMQDRLSRLVAIFEGLDFRANRAAGDDLLGDAYEYLMRHFATESGKSKGQFYTPAEVSLILAKVIGMGTAKSQDQTIYDPTCGSGSLLLRAAAESPKGISIYGQEMDNATWAMAQMNMILHNHPTRVLWRGNTLAAPYFKKPDGHLQTFDFVVANPPFSTKAWSNGLDPAHDEFNRFEYGIPPLKNGDYAFLLHVIKSLTNSGKGAVILPHGVLFRGNKEAAIRRNLVTRGLIKGIIGLPGNLFYGTGIPACVLVIDKEHAAARTGIFMVDASKGFIKDGNKNRLRAQDIHKIVDVFTRQIEVPGYSRLVPVAEIANPSNNYNLNIARYIDSSEPEDIQDLDAHLRGGIPNRDIDALERYWKIFPSLRETLVGAGDRPGYSRGKVESRTVKETILNHPEFCAFSDHTAKIVAEWTAAHEARLTGLALGSKPQAIVSALAEDLLARLSELPLLDRYDAYQRLMDYWASVMQDDVYLVASEGWKGAATPRAVVDDRERKIRETPDLVVGGKKYKMDLLPPYLLVECFFEVDREAIVALQEAEADAASALAGFVEEHTGEEGLLADAANEKGAITRASATQRLKALQREPDSDQERDVISRCLSLIDAEAGASKSLREAQAAIGAKVLARYGMLSETEIKSLVIKDKWFASVQAALAGEVHVLGRALAERVRLLEDRYALPLADLEREASVFGTRVEAHLKDMGLSWS